MDKRKRILYIITKSSWGGAQQYVYDLATHLPRDEFDVAVAAGGSGMLFEKLAGQGVRTIRLPGLERDVRPIQEFMAFWRLIRLLIAERPDVVHLNSSKAGALGAPAAKIASLLCGKKIRVILTVHGWGFREDKSLVWRSAVFLASFFSSLFQDAIILINTADFEAAQKFISRRKLHLIFNGLADIDFLPRTTARAFFTTACGHTPLPDTLFIGTIAELAKNKGLDTLIDAISSLLRLNLNNDYRGSTSIVSEVMPPFHLFIIGEGEEREALQNKIRDLGLEKIVTLLGFLADARRALTGFDIFVLPSRKEGLPYAVMEAMTAGVPVIATRVGGLPDLITDGADGILVPPKDAVRLADAIRALTRSADTRARISARAETKRETKFGFRAMLDDTITLYTSP